MAKGQRGPVGHRRGVGAWGSRLQEGSLAHGSGALPQPPAAPSLVRGLLSQQLACSTASVRSAAARPLCSRPSTAAAICWLMRLSSAASRSRASTTAVRLSSSAPNCSGWRAGLPPARAPASGEEDSAARAARASSGLRAMSLRKLNWCGAGEKGSGAAVSGQGTPGVVWWAQRARPAPKVVTLSSSVTPPRARRPGATRQGEKRHPAHLLRRSPVAAGRQRAAGGALQQAGCWRVGIRHQPAEQPGKHSGCEGRKSRCHQTSGRLVLG